MKTHFGKYAAALMLALGVGHAQAVLVTYNFDAAAQGNGFVTFDLDPLFLTQNGTEIDGTPEAGDLASSVIDFGFNMAGQTFASPDFEVRNYRFVSDANGVFFQGDMVLRQVQPVGVPTLSVRANGNWSVNFGGGNVVASRDPGNQAGVWSIAPTAVSEPATAALLGMGALLVLGRRRRRAG